MKQFYMKLLLAFFIIQTISLEARKPFDATATVATDSVTVSATNLVDLSRDLKTQSLEELLPIYTPVSPIAININLRGINVITSFAAGSTTLVVNIPQAGITTSFTGDTRDDSVALFKEYLRDGGHKQRLLKAYRKYSPIDPVAGNPASLTAQLGQSDYNLGRLSPLSGCSCCWSAQPVVHQFQAGLNIERAFCRGYDTTSVYLPLQYSYSPDLNWAFILDAPLTFHSNGGAYTLYGSVGLGVRVPLSHDWSITSIIRFGSGGSVDLAGVGSLFSTGLTSVYNFHLFDGVLAMTNYVGYVTSTNFWLSGLNFNYHFQDWVFKNGLSFTTCEGFTLGCRPFHINLFWVDTQYTGHDFFINHYDEIGVDLITTDVLPWLDYDLLSIGISYQFGQKNFKGYNLNMKYQF